jgi:hypothetical protein
VSSLVLQGALVLVGAGRGGGHAPGARDKHAILEK